MFKVVSKNIPLNDFKLNVGDIVTTIDKKQYLVTCDGWGQYYFIKLSDGFIVSNNSDHPYKVISSKTYKIGDRLFFYSENSKIDKVISKKNISITVEY